MKKMRDELKEIADQHSRFRLEVGSAFNEQKFPDARETAVVMNDKEVIVGRTEEKMEIMVSLSKIITEKFTILPIYGIGGIGKTTMAKTVFNDTMFNDYSRVWIYVSHVFDMKRIGNSIISQLSKMESQITEMQMIHTRLVELFAGKKILIVLDDLWEDNDQFQLDELKKMLKVSEDSKVVVIVTTRNESIANDLRTVQPYKLALLSDDSCWTIRLPALDTPKASCRMQIAVQASAAGSGMLCAMHSHPLYVA
jgi:replication-associated recombination protein RarA